ncbi:STT3 domain-containing protein [Winogradskyella sp.]|uniref:STT3 domain-containing protein n=1 Tax=Winogradskyella sp. TaxID=1883156 RepID=UPI003BA871D5
MSKKDSNALTKKPTINIDKRIRLWVSSVILLLIVLFAIYLRYEDFSVWKAYKSQFQYQDKYQMSNFDSYYYLQIARELQEGTYDSLQELRRVPNEVHAPYIPPLLSVLAASISGITGIQLETIAIFLPVFLASLLAPLVFLLCVRLNFNKIASLSAALFSILSITYIVRTRIGVFDTDCLNVVFVLLNTYLFYQFGDIKSKKRYTYLALGILSTFLFYTWWNTATSVVIISALVPFSVALIFSYETKKPYLKYLILGLAILISAFFISDEIIAFANLVLGKTDTAFPNNLDIAELDKITFEDFIKKTAGNDLIFYAMVIGIILLCWKLKRKALYFIIPIGLALSPFVGGNRFMIFSAPILAIGIGYSIHLLFQFKTRIKPHIALAVTVIIAIIGIASNYKTITHNYLKPAAYESIALLNAMDQHIPEGANVWTDWDLGYQIQYYLKNGTYADGDVSDGELFYYVAYPLAADNLAVSANFMRFYNKHGIEGMNTLYGAFSGVVNTFNFLNNIFSLSPKQTEQLFVREQDNGKLPKANGLNTPKEWVSFLFPRESEDIYVFFYYKMTQTAVWFKQGHSDLNTKKTVGLPLFLTFNNLQERGNKIGNGQIILDKKTGIANYGKQKRYFQSLSTFNGIDSETTFFESGNSKTSDNRFVFQWNKSIGFGAAMSKEMANTTLVKLYLLQEKSQYFEPVDLNTPNYQIWKITGNAYSN